jgi:hypothetical protein
MAEPVLSVFDQKLSTLEKTVHFGGSSGSASNAVSASNAGNAHNSGNTHNAGSGLKALHGYLHRSSRGISVFERRNHSNVAAMREPRHGDCN